MTSWQGQRIETTSTHGTGCTLASAIALFLAEAVTVLLMPSRERASSFGSRFLEAPGLGHGEGPIGHAGVRLDVGSGPRLNQVTVTGTNYAKSVDFYRRLGLIQIVDSPENGYARFETGGRRDPLGPDRSRREDPRDHSGLPRVRRPRATRPATRSNGESFSTIVRSTSRGCGARRGFAIPMETSSFSTSAGEHGAFLRGGWKDR